MTKCTIKKHLNVPLYCFFWESEAPPYDPGPFFACLFLVGGGQTLGFCKKPRNNLDSMGESERIWKFMVKRVDESQVFFTEEYNRAVQQVTDFLKKKTHFKILVLMHCFICNQTY